MFLQSNLTPLGEKDRPMSVQMTWGTSLQPGLFGSGDRGWLRSSARRDSLASESGEGGHR